MASDIPAEPDGVGSAPTSGSGSLVEAARRLVAGASRIVVLSGAGISTDSGIPDFRGPNGLWTRNPAAEKASNIEHYVADAAVRRLAWEGRLRWVDSRPQPNDGHRALVELERQGRLLALITQNVDGLHLDVGHSPDLVVEMHGTMREVECLSCGDRQPTGPVLDRVRAGDDDPHCERCGGLLKSATVSFGQSLRPRDIDRAIEAAAHCDLLLAVGSTLAVYPAAGMVPLARQHGAAVVIVNAEPTEMDDLADVVVRGSISDALPRLVGGAGMAGLAQ